MQAIVNAVCSKEKQNLDTQLKKMKKTTNKTVAELAAFVDGALVGDGDVFIERVASLEAAGKGDIAFIENEKLLEEAKQSKASCLILPEKSSDDFACAIKVKKPKLAFARIAQLLHSAKRETPSIHPTAVVHQTARISESAFIGPHVHIGEGSIVDEGVQIHAGCYIGAKVCIGRDSVLNPNVTLYDGVTLGQRVVLHAGVVIGADGFGYVRDESEHLKFPQIGTLVIEDDVEIGANSCVDRGALGETRIGRGTKLDNLVHVAHNVQIGERVIIVAMTGISGSVEIGDDVMMSGQVGLADHVRVESGAVIGAKSAVFPGKIVRRGVWCGIPVQPLEKYKEINANIKDLPRMREQLKELRKQVEELQKVIEK
jgi:UDP-3-O-[3-hydroxymyristoyl] glucosamine N-acyltransferase